MLKISSRPEFWWPVTVRWPARDGFEEHTLHARFERRTLAEMAELLDERLEALEQARDDVRDASRQVRRRASRDRSKSAVGAARLSDQARANRDKIRDVLLEIEGLEVAGKDGKPLEGAALLDWAVDDPAIGAALNADYDEALSGKLREKN